MYYKAYAFLPSCNMFLKTLSFQNTYKAIPIIESLKFKNQTVASVPMTMIIQEPCRLYRIYNI